MRDDEAQARRARAVVDTCVQTGEDCLVTDPVLCELEWVLEDVYAASRSEVAAAIRSVLTTPPFVVEHPDAAARALQAYVAGRADFSDYLLGAVGSAAGTRTTYTFDRALRGADDFTVLKA